MSYQKDRDEFVAQIVAEVIGKKGTNNDGVDLARLILRNAATIQRLAERAYSVEMSEAQTEREGKQDDRATECIVAACKPWGIKPTFDGDPRGACVKLILPSGRWNSWGGEEAGYCVPTR